tara:strand:- start:688 stop:1374 length:687 start_codon:yes stop_codon:yes gene_type:complete
MAEIYKILCKYLGTPPTRIKWKCEPFSEGNGSVYYFSPKLYYNTCIKPFYDVDNYINLINDPRNKYNAFYTVDKITNMENTNGPVYYNIPMNTLIEYAKDSIVSDEPVWFTCDMSKYTSNIHCVNGPSFFKNEHTDELTKKERLCMLDSGVTHAMVLHGFSKDKWKIENSWGSYGRKKGYYTADNIWINQYVYQMVISKQFVKRFPKTQQKPTKLPLFDPFGFLPVII